jgi:hypothetical protein
VRFVSLVPPRIVFAGRNKLFINAFGENIIGEQVCDAVSTASERTGSEVSAFTAAPRYVDEEHTAGAHEYVVEFERRPAGGTEAFAREIDARLREVNVDYNTKRTGDLGMTGVEVREVPEGTFYEWLRRRGKLGGQHKVPECANHRDFVDALRQIAAESTNSH